MSLLEVMDSRVEFVSANDYAIEALRMMHARKVPWICVLDRDNVTGVILAKDLEKIPDNRLQEEDVREHLQGAQVGIQADTEPQQAERLLRFSGLRFLIVWLGSRVAGILTKETLSRPGFRLSGYRSRLEVLSRMPHAQVYGTREKIGSDRT